jgi:D-glycero-alpha-D-manno-heptose-7-phosphate kinase
LSNLVSNSFIENLYEFAIKNGALAGKILGAGGGGFMLLMSRNKREKVKLLDKLKKFDSLNYKIENKGTHIVYRDTSDYY